MWRGLLVVGVGVVGWIAGRALPAVREAPGPAPCPQRLADATRALEAGEAARAGVPREFPAGIPPAFSPDGFERAAREVVAACPEAGMDVERVDCSEFPCAVVLAHREVASAAALRACPAWRAAFGPLGRDTDDVTMTPGGPARGPS